MSTVTESRENETQVACEICLREIPLSEARSDEASDYVRYFCGLDCYDQWHTRAKQAKEHQETEVG
jgi:hypothetical protein